MMNKKGEISPFATMVGIIVLVIVAILVILSLTGFFRPILDVFDKAPSNLETTIQSCNGYALTKLKNSYCDKFSEVRFEGKSFNEWINCADTRLELTNTLDCDGDEAKVFCINLLSDPKFTSATINGVLCEQAVDGNEAHYGTEITS